jgi:transposase
MQAVKRVMLRFCGAKIYLACGATDMRKNINGLAAIVELSLKMEAFEGLFVFCNRARDRLKILEWDQDGYWLHSKRLEKGRFKWPKAVKGAVRKLSCEELAHLFGGMTLI